MNKTQPIIKISLLLGTIIALGAFFLFDNNIPVQALHKEEQILDDYDDLQEFADAVKNGDEEIGDIPIQSMKASDIYDDADENMQDCIDLAEKIGDNLVDKEVVHCVEDVNFFKNKYSSNSSVPTSPTSTTDTGTDNTPASDDTTTTATDTGTSTATGTNGASTSNGTPSADDEESNLINELVKTGKFTEDEAKEFITKTMNGANGASASDGTSTSDTPTTSNTDTSTDNTPTTSNTDTSTDNTPSSNNEDTNDQSSNTNTNNPEEYDDLNELVDDIKNRDVDTDDISLNAFKDSGAYQGADANTQDCIDLAGKIGDTLGDQEIVHCSEDANYFKNKISNTDNNNNVDDNNNSNNPDDNSNNPADDTGN